MNNYDNGGHQTTETGSSDSTAETDSRSHNPDSDCDQISQETREEVLSEDYYRCTDCGRTGRQKGGNAILHVHHMAEDPDGCNYNDPENLSTKCARCHRWTHRMPERDDLEPALEDRLNGAEVEATWIEILDVLSESGPASISEIEGQVDLESKEGILQAFYGLMSLDIRKKEVTEQVLVKDRIHGTYGLPWQIPEKHTARGVIPMRPTERRVRLLDEIVRRLDAVLPDSLPDSLLNQMEDIDNRREFLGSVVDRDPHRTRAMQRRAEAFQFPFEEWADAGRPKQDSAAAIEAVEVLAGATENVSRQLVTNAVADVFSTNDEQVLADTLSEWIAGDDPYRAAPTSVPRKETVEVADAGGPSKDENQSNQDRTANQSAESEAVGTNREPKSIIEEALEEILNNGQSSADTKVQQSGTYAENDNPAQ